MKKNYQKPITDTILVGIQPLMSVSNPEGTVNSVTVSEDNYEGDASGVLSRRQGGWDD